MPDSDLVNFIQEQTQEGVPAQDLRVLLMEAGWHESDINNALQDVAAGLHPATPGVSIHADLAQVRTVVAHLASRVGSIEATLASTGVLETQGQLPTGTLGPDHELPAPKRHRLRHAVMLLVTVALFVGVGLYAADIQEQYATLPTKLMIIAAAVGVLLLLTAIVAMRRRSTWTAILLTASGVTLLGTVGLISWSVYALMQWYTAAALGVLLLVNAVVAGTWIHRYSTRP